MARHSVSHHPLALTAKSIKHWWSQSRNNSPLNSINISISNVKLAIQTESCDHVSALDLFQQFLFGVLGEDVEVEAPQGLGILKRILFIDCGG